MAEGDVEHRRVDIDDTVQLLLNFDEVQEGRRELSGSIFMVPSVYRAISSCSYIPKVVSIGPLHHQDEHLKGFEVQKKTYMHNLLHNVLSPALHSKPEQILKECVAKVSGSVDKIKACYFGMQTYPDSELVKMMVTDACFILAFLYDPYIDNYSSLGPMDLLRRNTFLDMVLIENQIPFFVLEDIYESTFLKLHPTRPLAKHISRILVWCNIFERPLARDNSSISPTYDHILGFLHKSYQNPDRDSSRVREAVTPHSAVELDRSGVRFSNNLDPKWPMAIELTYSKFLSFPLLWSKPTLKMPVLNLHDGTESIVRNIIIYEHFSKVQKCITSYMFALDMLIDTPEDVAELVKSQVLINHIGSNEEAAPIINNMLKEVSLEDFYYEHQWNQMDEYYNAYCPNLLAELRRKYFSNPWSIIALIAGIVLFVLTAVQTVYSVKDSKAA